MNTPVYSKELILDYNQVYSNYRKYNYLYFDFINNKILNNQSLAYTDPSVIGLNIGVSFFKDLIFYETEKGFTTKILLKNVPHIKTNNGKVLVNTGNNCVLIK